MSQLTEKYKELIEENRRLRKTIERLRFINQEFGIPDSLEYECAVKEPIRRGKWVNDFCSFCGQEAITAWNDTGGEHIYTPRCPWCGAYMEGVIGCNQ